MMPAGSPIGSGQGVLNPNNIRIILEDLKDGDPTYPVIVDAGVGTASDVAIAMELGCDGVLLNTGIAGGEATRCRMAHAMRLAVESGWLAAGAGEFHAGCTQRPRVLRRGGLGSNEGQERPASFQAHPMKFTGDEYYRQGSSECGNPGRSTPPVGVMLWPFTPVDLRWSVSFVLSAGTRISLLKDAMIWKICSGPVISLVSMRIVLENGASLKVR